MISFFIVLGVGSAVILLLQLNKGEIKTLFISFFSFLNSHYVSEEVN